MFRRGGGYSPGVFRRTLEGEGLDILDTDLQQKVHRVQGERNVEGCGLDQEVV